MVRIELSETDAEALAETLASALSDLRYEIANTDSLDYREGLKRKKTTLTRALEQLVTPRQRL